MEGFYEARQKVLYLHLRGTFDVNGLADIYEKFKIDFRAKVWLVFIMDKVTFFLSVLSFLSLQGFLKEWAHLRHDYARSLLFLFCVSHMLVCTHPSFLFDTSYIRVFRALDSVRYVFVITRLSTYQK